MLLLAAAGCRSIGPITVKRHRMHYSSAVARSLNLSNRAALVFFEALRQNGFSGELR